MIILGLNAYHGDSSAALVRDGALVAAAEEERFRRVKHWAGFPSEAIAYCLREANIGIADVQHVAVNQDSRANLLRKIGYLVTKGAGLGLVVERFSNRRKRQKIPELLAEMFPGERFSGAFHEVAGEQLIEGHDGRLGRVVGDQAEVGRATVFVVPNDAVGPI